MDLAAISAFVMVADKGGFRAAAMVLGMTSSGVSKAVSRLEKRLGVELLARTTRSVRLTPAGANFYARCKAILADLGRAEQEAADASAVPQGRLTISTSTIYGRNRVLPVLADFARDHPQIEIEVRLTDRFVDLMEEGVDLAIRVGHLPDSALIATSVAQTGYVLCGSPAYLERAGTPTHPDDLARHRIVGFVTPGTATRFAHRFVVDGAPRAMSFPSQMTVDDGEALVQAALRSVGLVMVVDYLVEDLIAAGRLVRLLRAFETPPMPISVVHLPTRHPSPALRALSGMLREKLRRDKLID